MSDDLKSVIEAAWEDRDAVSTATRAFREYSAMAFDLMLGFSNA